MSRIAVVHLVRAANGPAPFREFLDSYARHPAGAEHELVLLFKGFDAAALDECRALLGGRPHRALELPDAGFDLGPYFEAVRRFEHDRFVFLNSFSTIEADGWLGLLAGHLALPGVGAVGAAGSWESMYTTWRGDNDQAFFLKKLRPKFRRRRREMEAWFAPLPNYHLRTNAFMATREVLGKIRVPALDEKEDAHRFESGREGLSAQIVAQGLRLLVVGRDGRAYEKEDWPRSCTFRTGDQRNLLVADNQTRGYLAADDAQRRRLSTLAWGYYADRCA